MLDIENVKFKIIKIGIIVFIISFIIFDEIIIKIILKNVNIIKIKENLSKKTKLFKIIIFLKFKSINIMKIKHKTKINVIFGR